MSHAQFRPMFLFTPNGSQQYFIPQAIPALGQVNDDNAIQSQYPVVSGALPQQPSLYYHSLTPNSFAQPYSTYPANHTVMDDSNDEQLPPDSTISDSAMYPDMSTIPFSPPLTPQMPEQLEQQPAYLQSSAKRHCNAVAIINPETLEEVNVDDDPGPNDEYSLESKDSNDTVDNTWMIVKDMSVALNNLREGFQQFRDQVTKDIEELRNQNHQFQKQVIKNVEELQNQVTKNDENLTLLKVLVSTSSVSKLMVSKFIEIDSFEKFCVFAREAEMPCEPEDYEEFKYKKERMIEMNTRLNRKLFSL